MSLTFSRLFQQRDVRETPSGSTSSSSSTSILAPVGSILPWLKSYTNTPQALPTGWAECDGSVVSDADSVYDGQALPDLNGGEFIRGAATSGGTGGSDTMAHTHTTNVTVDNHTALSLNNHSNHTHNVSGTTGNESAHKHQIVHSQWLDNNTSSPNVNWWITSQQTYNTGAGTVHNHSFSDTSTSVGLSAHSFSQNIGAHTENNPATSAASNTENRPKYYNVVWIIRYK